MSTQIHALFTVDKLLGALPYFSVTVSDVTAKNYSLQHPLVHRANAEHTHLALYAPLLKLTDSDFSTKTHWSTVA